MSYSFSASELQHIREVLQEDDPRAAFRDYHHLDQMTAVQVDDVEDFLFAYQQASKIYA